MNIKISTNTIYILLTINAIFIALVSSIKGDMLMPTVFAFVAYSLALWVIILADMLSNPIYNKVFWIWSMFFIPVFSIFVYPFRRERLIQIGKNKKNR